MASRKRELGHTPDSLIASPSPTEGVRDKALPALPVSAAEDERVRLAERNRRLKLLKPDRPARVSFISEISTDDGLDIPTPKEKPVLLLRPTRAAAQSRLGAHISWASDVTSTTATSIGLGPDTEVKNDAPAVPLVPVVYDKSTPRSSIAPKSARTSMTTISSEGGESGRALERGSVYTHSNLSTECILLAEHLGFDDGPSTPELSGPGSSSATSVRSSTSSHSNYYSAVSHSRPASSLEHPQGGKIKLRTSQSAVGQPQSSGEQGNESYPAGHDGDDALDPDDVAAIYTGPRNPNRFTLSTMASSDMLRDDRSQLDESSGEPELGGVGRLFLKLWDTVLPAAPPAELPEYKPTPEGVVRQFVAQHGIHRKYDDYRPTYGADPVPGFKPFLSFPQGAALTVLGDWGRLKDHPDIPYDRKELGLTDSKIRLLYVRDVNNRRGWTFSWNLRNYKELELECDARRPLR